MKYMLAALVVIVSGALVLPELALGQDTYVAAIDKLLKEPKKQLTKWEILEYVAIAIAITVLIVGATVAIIQTLTKPWSKFATVILGVIVTLLTSIGSFVLELDHRQYSNLASQGRHAINQIEVKRDKLAALPLDEKKTRDEILEDTRNDIDELLDLPNKFKDPKTRRAGTKGEPGTTKNEKKSEFWVSNANAQEITNIQGLPEWVSKVPDDKSNYYFVGYADSDNLTDANTNSKGVAFDNARDFFLGLLESMGTQSKIDNTALASYLVASGRVSNTYYVFDRSRRYYRFFSQVALSKRSVETGLDLFGAREGITIPPEIRASILNSSRATNDYLAKRTKTYAEQIDKARSVLTQEQYRKFIDARNFRAEGRHAEAIRILAELVKAQPNFYMGWFNLALAYDATNRSDQAASAYRRAAEIEKAQNIGDASLYNSYGFFLYRNKQFADSVSQLQVALKLSPDHPKAQTNLKAANAALAKR